ncbi:hypothetical protein CVT25_014439 [Psilocybe cyanescens]|uniref:Fructose-1,6-bisphosphatase n=1 Tax=Psilocybe cyanescens TaxID=93625 RepID=A0A409XRG2_PSICY|nr:hypothetical protein CVT25_014439 [Psilocybe cyanescens]
MDHEEHVLNLSDVVHDEPIDDESPHDVHATDPHHESRPSHFDPSTSMMSPLHDNYNVSEHSNHLGTGDSYSVEMLEREIATLLNQNASAASAALLSAAAQQRQANIDLGREGDDGLDPNSENIAGLNLGLTGLAAVLQAVHAQSRPDDQRDSHQQQEQKTTRTAPAFHSLTAGETSDHHSTQRRRVDGKSGSEGSDYLFSEREDVSEREDFTNSERAMRHSSSPHHPTEDVPITSNELQSVEGDFSELSDILNQFSAHFEPDPTHGHGHDLSPPDSPPVISHAQVIEQEANIVPAPSIPILAPSNRKAATNALEKPKGGKEALTLTPVKKNTVKNHLLAEVIWHAIDEYTQASDHSFVHMTAVAKLSYRKYNFKGKKRKIMDDDDDDQELAESVRTISALFQAGGNSILPSRDVQSDEPLAVRVASISAEIAAAIAQAQSRGYEDEEDEEEESGSGQEMGGMETIGPNTSGIRGINDEDSGDKDEMSGHGEDDDDSDAFPAPLRGRKAAVASGKTPSVDLITLTRSGLPASHVLSDQLRLGSTATGDLTLLLTAIQVTSKFIATNVRKARLINLVGLAGETNVQGEEQKKLDVLSNDIMVNALRASGKTAVLVSEELEDAIIIEEEKRGKYCVVFDPLDGSSNIDAGVNIGTIFGIYKIQPGSKGTIEDVLRPGSEMVAAGYTMYGSSANLVLSTGSGVNGYTLDAALGEFILTHPNITIPPRGKIYSFNEGNAMYFYPPVTAYLKSIKYPASPKSPYSARYIGSMVADVHRTLLYGGIFGYPNDKKSKHGKLRLLYEAFPMAFLTEQAGGIATTGTKRILDIVPTDIHERCSVFLGSRDDVLDVIKFFKEVPADASV